MTRVNIKRNKIKLICPQNRFLSSDLIQFSICWLVLFDLNSILVPCRIRTWWTLSTPETRALHRFQQILPPAPTKKHRKADQRKISWFSFFNDFHEARADTLSTHSASCMFRMDSEKSPFSHKIAFLPFAISRFMPKGGNNCWAIRDVRIVIEIFPELVREL